MSFIDPTATVRNALIALAIGAALGAAGGWLVNGWRLGAHIERTEAEAAALRGANGRCSAAVADVKGAVKDLFDQGEKRAQVAEKAVKGAERAAKEHLGRAQAALERPPAPKGQECGTAAREAREYVDKRRRSP